MRSEYNAASVLTARFSCCKLTGTKQIPKGLLDDNCLDNREDAHSNRMRADGSLAVYLADNFYFCTEICSVDGAGGAGGGLICPRSPPAGAMSMPLVSIAAGTNA
jgi:hypothetical protein